MVQKKWIRWVLLIAGFLVTILATFYVKSNIDNTAKRVFESGCNEISIKINARLQAHAQILRDGAAFFRGADSITRTEWRFYIEQTKAYENMPGLSSIGFAQIVEKKNIASYTENIRKEGFPDFTIRPSYDRDFYTTIVFIEPFDVRNIRAFGFDMFTENVRREAMERSRDLDIPALSGKVILVQDLKPFPGYLIYVPVYRKDSSDTTLQQRRSGIKGWIYSPYRMMDFMSDILVSWNKRKTNILNLQIFDGKYSQKSNILYSSFDTSQVISPKVRFKDQQIIDFYNHYWLLQFSETGGSIFSQEYINVWFTAIGGVLISILIFLFANSLINTRNQAQQIALQLTRDLKQKESFLNTIIDENPYAIWISDEKGTLIRINKACCISLKVKEEEVVGKYNIFQDNIIQEQGFMPEVRKVFEKGEIVRFDLSYDSSRLTEIRLENTKALIVDIVIFPILNVQGKVTNAVIQHIDITDRKRAELQIMEKNNEIESQNEEYRMLNEELQTAKEKAEESDRLKSAFLQNMSHEIRTPMNAIMGFSELLPHYYNNKEKLQHFANIINQRSSDLLDIINDILDISKIESGQLKVKTESFNLNDLFTELTDFYQEYQKRIDKKNLRFIIHSSPIKNEATILTDKVKLKQILINLISNAFKFTEEGTIEVGYNIEANGRIVFYVSDTGIGIPLDKQNVIFDRFTQVDRQTNQIYGGTGLGLSIVKGLVQLLGGRIWLTSQPDKGSTFYFSLPFKTSKSSSKQIISKNGTYHFEGKNILIVEDDYYNTEYLKEILSNTGFNIVHTELGTDAVRIALNTDPDIILMDIRLPDMEGYTATREILQIKPHLKIIAQTAYASQNDLQKALDAGCVDYLSKPMKRDALLSVIKKHLSGS